ncbi:YdeI/OmpD-associated family protein [Echinicola shivajiensis]|uniref:YdeI/OmpD-associated family protein n=1 Tax=Echinicola shivajiensis TaxID=1035916 RepID=UPI001FE4C5D4|nr:YdeI/OmpD-associated family protein [Echinicola shivajiensis]
MTQRIMEVALIDREYLLEKFPGKGGWTYAAIPEIKPAKHQHFGWVTVKGSIDGYELKHYKLMPMGNGELFLPVKAAIRKKIKKEPGDSVRVILYLDESPLEIPDELMDCFGNEPKGALEKFRGLSDGNQKRYLDWIYSAKKEDTKADRIAQLMEEMLRA